MITTTLDFFNWAFEGLPAEHYIVGHFLGSFKNAEGKDINFGKNINCDSPKLATEFTSQKVKWRHETFYGLGMYTNNWESQPGKSEFKFLRKKEHAKFFRVIAFDVDVGVGKPYEDFYAALKPTVITLNKLGFTKAQYSIIKSGNGMHVYFKFTELIVRKEWELIGHKLKDACKKLALYIDPTKCGEAAMILRAVGTYNFKDKSNPKMVEMMHYGAEQISAAYILDLLEDYGTDLTFQNELQNLSGLSSTARIDFHDVEMLPTSIITTTDIETQRPKYKDVQLGCQQIQKMALDSTTSEPMWYLSLGVAAYTDEPKEAAIEWSKSHPQYNEGQTLIKMDKWIKGATGPAKCSKFMDLNPVGCEGCKFKDKITTPLQAKFVEALPQIITAPKQKEYKLPPFYAFKDGSIIKTNGDQIQPVVGFEFCLDGIAAKTDPRNPLTYVRFNINLPLRGWNYLELEMAAFCGGTGKGDTFATKCHQAGVVMHAKGMKALTEYAIDAIQFHLSTFGVAKVANQMGWTHDGHFIYGLKEYKGEGIMPETITPHGTTMITLSKAFNKAGSFDKWLQMVQILSQPGLENHAFGYLLGFATPLYKWTVLGGATINFYSESSGCGKTTSCNYGLSIYGKPGQMTGQKDDTINALFAKMSALNNIPLLTDELSDASGVSISGLLYAASSGKEKARADIHGEAKESRSWNTLLLSTSNKSFYDKLEEHTSSSSGQKNRLLEIEIPIDVMSKEQARDINITLDANHGHAGEIYINKLVDMYRDEDLVEKVQKSITMFEEHFKFDFLGEERFVGGVFACAWLGAKIASELDLCPGFNLDKIFSTVLQRVADNRHHIKDAIEPAEDVLNQFLVASNQHMVKIIENDAGTDMFNNNGYPKYDATAPSGAIMGRVVVKYKDLKQSDIPYFGTCSLDINAFKNWCRKNQKPVHKYLDDFMKFRDYKKSNINITEGVLNAIDRSPVLPFRLTVVSFQLPLHALELMQSNLPVVMHETDFPFGDNL